MRKECLRMDTLFSCPLTVFGWRNTYPSCIWRNKKLSIDGRIFLSKLESRPAAACFFTPFRFRLPPGERRSKGSGNRPLSFSLLDNNLQRWYVFDKYLQRIFFLDNMQACVRYKRSPLITCRSIVRNSERLYNKNMGGRFPWRKKSGHFSSPFS